MQGLFKNTTGQFLRLVIFSSISIILIYVDYRDDTLRIVRSAVGTAIVEPVKFIATLPSAIISSSRKISTSRQTLVSENENLKQKNQKLINQVLIVEGLQAENNRLRELLNSTKNLQTEATVAEVVAIDLDPFKQIITLNKGKNENINIKQSVVDAFGVMGQIINTTNNTASTLLISDPAHSLPVQILRNGLRTLANGTGNADELDIKYIPANADIREGDLVITSGLGGIFPKNYPVGTISKVSIEAGQHFLSVKAKPTAQLNRSREVLILKQVEKNDP